MKGVRWEICHWPRVAADAGAGRHLSKRTYGSIFWRARPSNGTVPLVRGATVAAVEYPDDHT